MKIALTASLLAGVGLLLAWPWILGPQPPSTHRAELQGYMLRFGIYFCTLLVIFFANIVLATIVVRRAREEYRQELMGNVKFLIETTLEDHRRKDESHDA